jgi:hypothetical protein
MPPASSHGLRSDAPSSGLSIVQPPTIFKSFVCHGLHSSATSQSTSTIATQSESSHVRDVSSCRTLSFSTGSAHEFSSTPVVSDLSRTSRSRSSKSSRLRCRRGFWHRGKHAEGPYTGRCQGLKICWRLDGAPRSLNSAVRREVTPQVFVSGAARLLFMGTPTTRWRTWGGSQFPQASASWGSRSRSPAARLRAGRSLRWGRMTYVAQCSLALSA